MIHTPTDNILPIAVHNNVSASATGVIVDTRGYTRALIMVTCNLTTSGTLDAKVQESSDSGMSGAADVSGAAIVQLAGSTSNRRIAMINLNLEKRLRYITVPVVIANTVSAAVHVILFNPDKPAVTQSITPITV